MALSQEFLNELKYQNDIVSVVESYVSLKRSARNRLGVCPFHSEKTPSFTVFPESQSYYCFGCGAGGDVITFIRQIENLEYIEAVRFLAQRAGMSMPEDTSLDDRQARLKKRIFEINKVAARFFFDTLTKSENGREGLDYFAKRQMSPATIKHFGLGFAPDSWHDTVNFLKQKGFTEEEIIAAGLGARGKNGGLYDVYRKRVMFPIIDLRGNVIAFGGRVLDNSKPKYINTSDTPIYKKTRNLFALNFAKNVKDRKIILCEGYMDVIALHQAGFENAVACLGTALTDEQARLVASYADEVITCYDSDDAGQKATRRAFDIFDKIGIKVNVLNIPDAKDPDEFIKKFGAGRFKLLIDGAKSVTDFLIANVKEKYDINVPADKVNYLKGVSQILASLPNAIERDVYMRKIANELEISVEAIKVHVESLISSRKKRENKREARDLSIAANKGLEKVDPERARHLREAKCEDEILGCLFKNPDKLEWVLSKITPDKFVTSFNKRIFEAVKEKIKQFGHIDISDFSADFPPEDMGRISRILQGASANFDEKTMLDYISALLECADRPDTGEIKQMSDDELKSYIDKIKDKKNRG